VKPRRLESMLDELSALATAVAAGAPLRRPRVTLYLHSGQSLSGELLEVTRDGGSSIVSLQLESSDTAFVPASALEALVVRDVENLNQRVSDTPAPSKLELRRAFTLAEDRWRTLGVHLKLELPRDLEQDAVREALLEVLKAIEPVIGALKDDDLGRSALGKLSRLRFDIGSSASVTRDGDGLRVSVPLHFALRPDSQGWRSLLEAQL
jgi:hypothetical protein